jgi:hypothetical protein
MREHLLARLLAPAALLGTFLHNRIVRGLLTFFTTALAHLRARLADRLGVHPLAGGDAGRGGTMGCTILTAAQDSQVILFALGEKIGTVTGTAVTGTRAVTARFGTMLVGGRLFVFGSPARTEGEQTGGEGGDRQTHFPHRSLLLGEPG